jgi:hypothetical protein
MKRNALLITLGTVQLIVAISAIPAGIMLIQTPDGSDLGLSLDALTGSPFSDYLIPGIFLLLVNGLGSLIATFVSFKKKKSAVLLGIGLGLFLIFWILIQVFITGWVSFLQPLFLVVGIIELVLALWLKKLSATQL